MDLTRILAHVTVTHLSVTRSTWLVPSCGHGHVCGQVLRYRNKAIPRLQNGVWCVLTGRSAGLPTSGFLQLDSCENSEHAELIDVKVFRCWPAFLYIFKKGTVSDLISSPCCSYFLRFLTRSKFLWAADSTEFCIVITRVCSEPRRQLVRLFPLSSDQANITTTLILLLLAVWICRGFNNFFLISRFWHLVLTESSCFPARS